MDANFFPNERATLLAALSGSIAYLCTQDKMPPLRALAYVIGGCTTAAYVGPGIVDYLARMGNPILVGERLEYAIVFLTGVGGIWLLNIVVAFLKAVGEQASEFVRAARERIFGKPPER